MPEGRHRRTDRQSERERERGESERYLCNTTSARRANDRAHGRAEIDRAHRTHAAGWRGRESATLRGAKSRQPEQPLSRPSGLREGKHVNETSPPRRMGTNSVARILDATARPRGARGRGRYPMVEMRRIGDGQSSHATRRTKCKLRERHTYTTITIPKKRPSHSMVCRRHQPDSESPDGAQMCTMSESGQPVGDRARHVVGVVGVYAIARCPILKVWTGLRCAPCPSPGSLSGTARGTWSGSWAYMQLLVALS